jgi:L-asparagine oxygenase
MKLAPKLLKELHANGCVYLESLEPEMDTQSIAQKIGKVISSPDFLTVQSLTPKDKVSATKNMYSGNFGLDEFPLHTDMSHWYRPPRYFILRASVPASGVATTVLNHRYCLEGISEETVRRAIFQPRRKIENKTFFLRILEENIFRWDEVFIVPKNKDAHVVSQHIAACKQDDRIIKFFLDKPGDTLLIDNWQVLHGRTAIPASGINRKIERVYLSEVLE